MILLDTHVLAWAVAEPERLSRTAASAIKRARMGTGIGLAAISLLELAVMFTRGQLRSQGSVENSIRLILESSGTLVMPITPAIAALATQFPESYPRDPADRLIGATARAEGLPLVTRDERIRSSPLLKTIW
ncbi:MAG TPA: type II toxin-antitoxin system VapC family toxin [Terriglobales bacterium]|jgi:PIN domain nuclease of toxin-antitoxin system|nr:type II toxin-antitoxin system VapC family toxin [Terriglobales bacterium]